MATSIALISDSHSYIDNKTLAHLTAVDEIWHAGDIGSLEVMEALPKDKVIRAVYGNIDDYTIQQLYPEWLEFTLEGLKVVITHIGGKPPRYAKGIKARLKASDAQIFVTGHSHICKVEYDRDISCLYINPGAIGQQGFHLIRTMLLFDMESGQVKNLKVVELGKRGVLK